MAKSKKETVEVPVEVVETETPVEVEPEKKFDLKAFGKKALKWTLWIGLGAIAFVAIGAAAISTTTDDLDDSSCEDLPESVEPDGISESSDSGTSTEE